MVSGRPSSAGSSGSSSSCSLGRGGVEPPSINGGGNASADDLGILQLGGAELQQSNPNRTLATISQQQVQIMTDHQVSLVMGKDGGTGTNGGSETILNHHSGSNNSNNILLTPQEKRVIAEFSHLLEKSKQLFNQLRELPHYGSSSGAASSSTVTTPGATAVASSSIIQIQTLLGTNSCSTSGGTTSSALTTSASATFTCQQAYFSRAFDIYTRLWKYQQTHRNILDKKYGLKRWQIGDIASKIGQLYYHYYLRTSDISYLVEAANFYGAIRGRGYYARTPQNSRRESGVKNGGSKEKNSHHHNHHHHHNNVSEGSGGDSGLIVKKLRYYARFVIVSMLLRKNNVKELLRELSSHVENYVATVDEEPEEQLEWNLVLSEIRSFIDADSPVEVYEGIFANGEASLLEQLELGMVGQPLIMSYRLPKEIPKFLRDKHTIQSSSGGSNDIISGGKGHYAIQEVIIIGNKQDQLKFSELTVDMFRMMQTFERSPENTSSEEGKFLPSSEAQGKSSSIIKADDSSQVDAQGIELKNPHKYLLYRATIEQILANLNSAWSELSWNGVLLVYISSDPSSTNGIATLNSNPMRGSSSNHHRGSVGKQVDNHHQQQSNNKEIHCLYPYDFLPLTRKPLVAIVDSDNSHVFLQLGGQKENFGQPLVILVSPEVIIGSPSSSSSGFLPLGSNSHHHGSSHHHHQISSSNRGSIFTLFLHSPLSALCTLCGVKVVSSQTWNGMDKLLNVFYKEALDHILEEAPQHNSDWDVYLKLIGDDFFRMVFLRYLFCHTVYSMHKESQESSSRPKSFPEVSLLNQDKIETSRFEELIFEIADSIQSKNLFKRI